MGGGHLGGVGSVYPLSVAEDGRLDERISL